MWVIVLPFLAGLLIGWRGSSIDRFRRFLDPAVLATLFLLLLGMGARVGSDPRVTTQLGEMGVQAIVIAAFAVAGSVLAVRIALRG